MSDRLAVFFDPVIFDHDTVELNVESISRVIRRPKDLGDSVSCRRMSLVLTQNHAICLSTLSSFALN